MSLKTLNQVLKEFVSLNQELFEPKEAKKRHKNSYNPTVKKITAIFSSTFFLSSYMIIGYNDTKMI